MTGGKATKHIVETIAKVIFLICAAVAIVAVLSITVYMFAKGTPALAKVGVIDLLFGTVWQPTAATPSYGILYIILTSIVGTAVAILIGVPIGILTAVFINPLMYRLEKRVFAGSTTHQFTGGSNLLSAIIVLAIMILPTVINISVSSIRAVPGHLKSASLALGATHIQTIFKVMIPAARSGIMTGVVLGIGRALGEAMAINMVAGGSVNLPLPFNSVRFLTTQIVSEMSYAEGLHREVLFTVGLVLFIFIMIINLILAQVEKKGAVEQ